MKTAWTDTGAVALTEDGGTAWTDRGAIYLEPSASASAIKKIGAIVIASVKKVGATVIASVKKVGVTANA